MQSLPSIAFKLLLTVLLVSTAHARKPEPSRLLRTLTGTSNPAKLREIEKLARRPKDRNAALPDLIEAANNIADKAAQHDAERLSESTLALWDLIGSSNEPTATDALINLLRAEHTKVAMASAEALGRNNRTSALVALRQQIKRPDYASSYAFRFSLLKSIALLRSPEAVNFLLVTLPTLDGQLKHEVTTFLSQVELIHFRGDQEKFDAWKANIWEPLVASGFSNAEPGTPASYRSQHKRATYYGMPIYARRVVFVIDRSPSMDEMVDGQSRLRRAMRELTQVINALDPSTEFSVVVFEGRVKAWQKSLGEASHKNKLSVIKFARQHYRSGLTNTYGALRTALNLDENTEAIYLISDGEPTTGTIQAPGEIIDDITRRNEFRYITINTVGIALSGTAQQFMQELAEQNGGEYRDTQ